MEMQEMTQEVLDAVKAAAPESRLSCPKARRIAKELGVAPQLIGQACDELKIKLKDCELGCF